MIAQAAAETYMNGVTTRRPSHNLPGALTSFIGRQQEIAEVGRLLGDYRLLTLTGPGGCGKTRLALEVGREAQPTYADGVWLVELAAVGDGELVPQTVATALGLRERADEALLDSLVAHLRPRHILILLDNCEHLLEACAELGAALLAACLEVRILATSREPLGVPGEGVWLVPPLSLPAPQPWRDPTGGLATLDDYRQAEAMQLFEARARAALPSFELTTDNSPWVAEICRRLDGIPLALELAAARVRVYSARQIAERLDDRFRLLTTGLRAAPQRHQTLAATLDWSYDLLSEKERILLRRLAVFAGGWTLEAAEVVCAGDGIKPAEIIDLFPNLVDKSLVVVERLPDSRRYDYLETIRQYAQQKLGSAREVDATRDRHLAYFRRWVEESAPHLYLAGQSEWLERFDAEHDNIRAALEWSLTDPTWAEYGLRLAAACWKFWRIRGYYNEGRERLAAALGRAEAQARTEARAWALLRAANLAYLQSDYSAVRPPAREALAIFRELGLSIGPGAASTLSVLGELATEVGDYEAAPRLFDEALAVFRELKDDAGTAEMLLQLGYAAMRVGEYGRAATFLTNENLVVFRKVGDKHLLGLALSGLGELAIRQKRLERANALLAESLAVRREIDEKWGIAVSLGSLGWVALLQRDFGRMRERLKESMEIRAAIGEQSGIAWCLEKLAEASVIEAQSIPSPWRRSAHLRAVCLFGAAEALRKPVQSVIDPVDQPEHERGLAALRAALGDEAFDAAWAKGAGLPLPEVVEMALEGAVSPADAAALTMAQAEKAQFAGLTARERDTARLIAQGKSNREIAAIMTVGVKTVETYVTRIMNKLGFDSRVQIALWATEKGLDNKKNEL
jgi:predicted ATPase/DNA-binding CsgD family transcriptional regulator